MVPISTKTCSIVKNQTYEKAKKVEFDWNIKASYLTYSLSLWSKLKLKCVYLAKETAEDIRVLQIFVAVDAKAAASFTWPCWRPFIQEYYFCTVSFIMLHPNNENQETWKIIYIQNYHK